MRTQRRIPGLARQWAGGGLHPDVKKLVDQDARRFKVSRSFVLASIATQHYERVTRRTFDQERFDVTDEKPRRTLRLLKRA